MIKDHGTWEMYKPDRPLPKLALGAPNAGFANVIYCRNSAGEDWYDYRKNVRDGVTKVLIDPKTKRVLVAHTDTSMLFPAGGHLYELDRVMDYETELKFRIFHADTDEFEDDGFLASLATR